MAFVNFAVVVRLALGTALIVASDGYSIPRPTFTITSPRGLRVSIPDEPGIQMFSFHGRLNKPLLAGEPGEIVHSSTAATNGRWEFYAKTVSLQPDDVLHYWLFVQHNRTGHQLDGQRFMYSQVLAETTSTLAPSTTPSTANCRKSTTFVNGQNPCQGELLFEDNFDTFNPKIWRKEVRIPLDSEDADFVSFQNDDEECYTRNGTLFIAPHLLSGKRGFSDDLIYDGVLDLGDQCTEITHAACYRTTSAGFTVVLPPIVSAKINTRESFSFLYGKVEIRAKLPKGQWLFPLLNLEATQRYYGGNLYDSGMIRIAFARGNDDKWRDNNFRFIDGRTIYAGLILSPGPLLRSRWTKFYESPAHLGDDFHVYTANWTPDYISFELDGERYAIFNKNFVEDQSDLLPRMATQFRRGTAFAPFDREFYLSLGVSAGGIADFPDLSGKPWSNTKPNAEAKFWDARQEWLSTWRDEQTALQVDYVRVYAL